MPPPAAAAPASVILYHYPYSPYARKVFWYLRLRKIPFTQVIQPPILPRPDLSQKLNITYRRIPVVAIDRDIYCDTRLILRTLEARFPPNSSPDESLLGVTDKNAEAWTRLLEEWADEVFPFAAKLLPTELPLMKEGEFLKDRLDYGYSFDPDGLKKSRPEALANLRRFFHTVEHTFLAGNKQWILGGDKPTLADIMAIWPLHWLTTLPGSLSPSITVPDYPSTFSWLSRFTSLLSTLPHAKTVPTISGEQAKAKILSHQLNSTWDIGIDEHDPLGLEKGEDVFIVPTDSGTRHPQKGKLVGIGVDEVAVEVVVPGGDGKDVVRVHFPRGRYRVGRWREWREEEGEKAKI
ncbi:hypothetical protein BDZ91DRAFT_698154 [Kalaharituber pfeilii]|nr:hypothetical protein BDZ91DRAFT_698154 [Kalaharituber pfeilii]